MTAARRKHTGFSLRRPRGGKRSVAADIRAEVISRHRSARTALKALRSQPRSPEGGYSQDFVFDEKRQVRLTNFEADRT